MQVIILFPVILYRVLPTGNDVETVVLLSVKDVNGVLIFLYLISKVLNEYYEEFYRNAVKDLENSKSPALKPADW